MTKREELFCYEIARFLCWPRAFEIGGVSCDLKEIIRTMTLNNKTLRKKVLKYCKEFVCDDDFDSNAYGTDDYAAVLKYMEDDYNNVFF